LLEEGGVVFEVPVLGDAGAGASNDHPFTIALPLMIRLAPDTAKRRYARSTAMTARRRRWPDESTELPAVVTRFGVTSSVWDPAELLMRNLLAPDDSGCMAGASARDPADANARVPGGSFLSQLSYPQTRGDHPPAKELGAPLVGVRLRAAVTPPNRR
jgi:hypothetical protein